MVEWLAQQCVICPELAAVCLSDLSCRKLSAPILYLVCCLCYQVPVNVELAFGTPCHL